MLIKIHSTSKIVNLAGAYEHAGISARVWEGVTESGVKVHCFITRIAIDVNETPANQKIFQEELQECKPPSAAMEKYPLRIIL